MLSRRRDNSGRPLTSAKLLDVLDRVYDLDALETDWLRGIGEAVRPLVDCGAGVTVHTLTLPSHPTEGGRISILGLGNDADAMWTKFARVIPWEIMAEPSMTAPLSNADRCATPRIRAYAAVGHSAMGVLSHTAINAPDLEHRVMSIGIPAPLGGSIFWPRRDRAAWERLSAHLGAAFRMRSRARQAPALVVDQRGHAQHVAPGLDRVALARLREAVAAVSQARRLRMSPEAVLEAWRALHGGRWSIVESVERDGQRFLIARPNVPLTSEEPCAAAESAAEPPPRPGPDALSAQERRVLVALSKGHSNKFIAYELGLATSTVGTLLARAARKLGCKDRVALARAARAIAHPRQPEGAA